jgi:hypothetical protein
VSKVFYALERIKNVENGIEAVGVPDWDKPISEVLKKEWDLLTYYAVGNSQPDPLKVLPYMWNDREEIHKSDLPYEDLGYKLDFLEFIISWQLGLPYHANASFSIVQHLEKAKAVAAVASYIVLAVSGVIAVLTLVSTFLIKIGVRLW